MLIYQKPRPVADEEKTAPQCRQHWIIEPADGPVSRGMCRVCRETREFRNSISEIERESLDLRAYQRAETSGYYGTPEF